MGFTRRRFVRGAAAATLAARMYGLADALAAAPPRPSARPPHFPEQNVIQDLRIVTSDGVLVFEPPRYSEVVTVALQLDRSRATVAEARAELERRLEVLDQRYPSTPAGLAVTVAWGLPYFGRFVPAQARRELPRDVRASAARGRPVSVLEPAERFPSDPSDLILEENDLAVLLRSDSLERIAEGSDLLFSPATAFLRITSRRRGFAGGGFDGGPGLPKLMATAAGLPGAESIPHGAELFLGFTSTPKERTGLERIVNLETLGYADLGPSQYFRHGTHMHLSHLYEDLEAWYSRPTYAGRVASMFQPGLEVTEGRQTLPQGPAQSESHAAVARDYRRHGLVGHSGSIQPASRLDRDVLGPDGVLYGKGSPIAHRADFNTLDNPFSFSADPARDRLAADPAAGLHFVVFNPTSDDFRRNRLAMDGRLPGTSALPLEPRSQGMGINHVIRATHRQNFLVPPRVHRSFPLSELPA
jgi:hypothetical protein